MAWNNWARQGADTVTDTESYPHAPFPLAAFCYRGWEANLHFPDSLACGTVLTHQT